MYKIIPNCLIFSFFINFHSGQEEKKLKSEEKCVYEKLRHTQPHLHVKFSGYTHFHSLILLSFSRGLWKKGDN